MMDWKKKEREPSECSMNCVTRILESLWWFYPDINRLFNTILLNPLNNVEQPVRNSEGQTKENIALVCNAI